MIAAMGRQLKQSVKVFHNLMLYRRLPRSSGHALALKQRGLTLVVETVDPVDTGTLVISSENEKVFGVLDLVGEQQADSL